VFPQTKGKAKLSFWFDDSFVLPITRPECMRTLDANKLLDDPKAQIMHLFTETDLVDLHHHKYPGIQTTVTHQ